MKIFKRRPAAKPEVVRPKMALSDDFDVLEYAEELELTPAQDHDVFYAEAPPVDLHVSRFFDEIAQEQKPQHRARGEAAARETRVESRALIPEASTQAMIIDQTTGALAGCNRLVAELCELPVPRRSRSFARIYPYFQAGLSIGDGIGCGLSLWMAGEQPWIVWPLSLALGIAVMLIGTSIGKEFKEKKAAALREGDVPPGLERYHGLFRLSPSAKAVMDESFRQHAVVGLGVCGALGIGYGFLRSYDVSLAVFFAVAQIIVALGSAANSYLYTDEVADIQDNIKDLIDYFHGLARNASHGGALASQLRNQAADESIRREHDAAGEGAEHRSKAAGIRAIMDKPQYAGTGVARDPKTSTNGKAKRNDHVKFGQFKAKTNGKTNGGRR